VRTRRFQNFPPQPRQAGFSLIELMVGVVLALIAVIVIMQVFQQAEAGKRTTTGTSSAAMDGALAATDLQRDLRQAGAGIINSALLGCSLTLLNGKTLDNLAPVVINSGVVPAGDAGSDTLLIVYGNFNGSPDGDKISAQAGSTLTVAAPSAYAAGDYVVPTPQTRSSPCGLQLYTATSITGAAPSGALLLNAAPTNSPVAIYDLGQLPHIVAYAVRNGRLTQCDFVQSDCTQTANYLEIYDGVVNLRAVYGHNTSTPPTYDQATPTAAATWEQISILRIALTLRSGQLEKTAVTGNCAAPLVCKAAPTWSQAAVAPINVTGLTSWQNYRYFVFEAAVQLRNVANLSS